MRDHKSLLAWQEAKAVVRAYALRSSKRLRNHLDIAYASAVETAELLELAEELGLSAHGIGEGVKRCHRCQGLLLNTHPLTSHLLHSS